MAQNRRKIVTPSTHRVSRDRAAPDSTEQNLFLRIIDSFQEAMKLQVRLFPLKDRVKILVGGAPITLEFANSIGADGFGVDAVEGVKKAKELLNGSKS